MRRNLLSLVAAASVAAASVGRADEPPRPPEGHPPVILEPAQSWTAPACERPPCGLCFDPEGYAYQDEVRRYYETRIQVAEEHAERASWKGMLLGISVGVFVGGLAALARR